MGIGQTRGVTPSDDSPSSPLHDADRRPNFMASWRGRCEASAWLGSEPGSGLASGWTEIFLGWTLIDPDGIFLEVPKFGAEPRWLSRELVRAGLKRPVLGRRVALIPLNGDCVEFVLEPLEPFESIDHFALKVPVEPLRRLLSESFTQAPRLAHVPALDLLHKASRELPSGPASWQNTEAVLHAAWNAVAAIDYSWHVLSLYSTSDRVYHGAVRATSQRLFSLLEQVPGIPTAGCLPRSIGSDPLSSLNTIELWYPDRVNYGFLDSCPAALRPIFYQLDSLVGRLGFDIKLASHYILAKDDLAICEQAAELADSLIPLIPRPADLSS